MPDGDFLQSDKKRDGLLARAGSRFEEFRQQLGRIFEAAEAKKQTKDAKMQAVLAIAEADIKRLQEQARPIDEMVTQAKKDATLLGVHLSLRNVMGEVYEKTDIPEATREKIQAALKVFRSGLVEVLGEEKRGIEQAPSIAQALKEELGAGEASIEGEVMGEPADEPQALEEPATTPAFLERKGPSDAIKYRDLLSKLQKKFDSLSAFGDSPSEKDQAIVKALSRLQECTDAREAYEAASTMDARNAAWERVLEFEWSDIAAELKEYTREVTKDRDAQVKVKERTEIDTKSRLDADTRLAIAEELKVFIAGEGDEMPEKKRKKAPPKRDPRELKPRTPGEREIANAIDRHFNGGEGSVRKGATIVEVKGPNIASKIETNSNLENEKLVEIRAQAQKLKTALEATVQGTRVNISSDILQPLCEAFSESAKGDARFSVLVETAEEIHALLDAQDAYEKLAELGMAKAKFLKALSENNVLSSQASAFVEEERAAEVKTAGSEGENEVSDEVLVETILDTANPARDDLKGPFERMMLLAGQADGLSRRAQADASKQQEYLDKVREVRAAYQVYKALEQASTSVPGNEGQRVVVAAGQEIDKAQDDVLESAAETAEERTSAMEAAHRFSRFQDLLLGAPEGPLTEEKQKELAQACDEALESIQKVDGLDAGLLAEAGKQLRSIRNDLHPSRRLGMSDLADTRNAFVAVNEEVQDALYALDATLNPSQPDEQPSAGPDLAAVLRASGQTVKPGPQAPDASLKAEGGSGPVEVPAAVAERLKAEAEARAEARAEKEAKDVTRMVETLKKEKKKDAMDLAALFTSENFDPIAFETLVDQDLRIHVARWLVDFMDGRYEMVRLPAQESWKEVVDENGKVTQVMEANEADDDEYAKRAVAESRYATAAVVKAGVGFGFSDEASIRATASEELPSEQQGGLGNFVMDAGKALSNDRRRQELQVMGRELDFIKEKLGKHDLKLASLTDDEKAALEARRDELMAVRMKLMEVVAGKSLKDLPAVEPTSQTVENKASEQKVEKLVGSGTSFGKEKAGWKNQDSFLIDDENGLYGVFDGVGGLAAGDRASQLVRDYVQSRAKEFAGLDAQAAAQLMADIMNKTAEELDAAAQTDEKLKGMGTTFTLIKMMGDEAVIGQAGDSRVYTKTETGGLRALTLDNNEAMDEVLKQFGIELAFVFQQAVDELNEAKDWEAFKGKTNEELAELDFSPEEIQILRDKGSEFESLIPFYFWQRNVITASAGQGGRVDIYDMKGKRELVLTSDGIHDNLQKKEIKIILSGRYEELEDAELREGLSGITDPMEALATAARIRSKQKGNPRAKPDDMTAVLVASKNPSEAVRTAAPDVDAKDVPAAEKVEGEKKSVEEEKATLRESITEDRAVLETSKEKLEKGIVIYQGAVHVPYLRQVVDWFEKLIEAKQDVVSKWNFPEEKQKSEQRLATYERNLPKRHRMTMKGQIKELQGYLDASAKKITELEKHSKDKKELKEELRQTKNWQDEVKFALDIVEGIYKRTEAHEEDVMPSSLKVTTASTPSPDTSAPAKAPPAPVSPDAPASPSATDHTAPDTAPPAPGAPPAMPPAPSGLPPLPTFAHPDLFRQGDRGFLEGWLKDQQTRLGYVRNMIAEPALTDARKRHPSFDVHAGRFEKIIEATAKLTQASTEAERLSAERALQDLREQGPWPIGSAEALAGLKEQQTYAQENLGYYKAANSKSEKIKEAIAQAKAKLEEVNADIYLMELDAQLEQALSEVTLLKDEGKKDELGERIATNEQKAETRETDWKKVAAESEEAQTKFIAAMETREIYDESEPTFGPIFTAFQREQEATIDLNKALRQFNVLDATETRITQTLRLLDREGSGPVSEQVWAAMPSMVRVFLRTVHEDQNSTVGNIKARLYERLRGITQDKIEANKELQQTAQLIEGLREKSSYVLALNAYQKMERETKELKNALHSLKGELEEHNPATAKKTGDRVYFIEKTQELTARYELLQNQYERKQSLLQDAQGLVELSQKALWGQAQQLDEEATVSEASAYKALEAQADIANGLIKIIEGQKLHKNKQASQEVREAELRKSLPSQPTVVGGANVFGRGGGEQTNRTSGGAKEEPSFWQQAQKWPGVGSIIKGGKDLLSAFGIDLN